VYCGKVASVINYYSEKNRFTGKNSHSHLDLKKLLCMPTLEQSENQHMVRERKYFINSDDNLELYATIF
jgi:hypothetical protein